MSKLFTIVDDEDHYTRFNSPEFIIDGIVHIIGLFVGDGFYSSPQTKEMEFENIFGFELRIYRFTDIIDEHEDGSVARCDEKRWRRFYTRTFNRRFVKNSSITFSAAEEKILKNPDMHKDISLENAELFYNICLKISNNFGKKGGRYSPVEGAFCRACGNFEFYSSPDGLPDGKLTCYVCKQSPARRFRGIQENFEKQFMAMYFGGN